MNKSKSFMIPKNHCHEMTHCQKSLSSNVRHWKKATKELTVFARDGNKNKFLKLTLNFG